MTDLVATWAGRNAISQAEMLVSHPEPTVLPEAGWQVVTEWRYKALYADDWGPPDTRFTAPPIYTDTYVPVGDGWVQLNCYAIQDGKVSWDGYLVEIQVYGGGIVIPRAVGDYVDQDDNNYVNQNDDLYEG